MSRFISVTFYDIKLNSELYTYFSENNLLSEQRYGFRAKHSTELASVKHVDYIIKQMDNVHGVKTPVAIFCYLSKTFDS